MTALDQLAAVALESELQLQQEEAQARDAQTQVQAQADGSASLGVSRAAEDAGGEAGAAAALEPALGSGAGQVSCWKLSQTTSFDAARQREGPPGRQGWSDGCT